MIEFVITVAVLLNYLKPKQVEKLIYLRKSQIHYGNTGDKNSTRPLVKFTSEIYKGRVIIPKALVLQDECFGKNYWRKSYCILLPYVLYCIHF